MRLVIVLWLTGLLMPLVSVAAGLGPYQLILDKQLLGTEKVVPVSVPATEITQAAPSWSRDYRMTMITQDADRLRVGLQNLKNQSSLLLIEGEKSFSSEEFELVSGDYQRGAAIIRYRGAEHRFLIESGASSGVTTPEPENRDRGGRAGFSRSNQTQPGVIRTSIPRAVPTPAAQVRRFNNAEELKIHLQEQNMDAIRTGKPPLPIPLTPENDAQLVKEGVLPPR